MTAHSQERLPSTQKGQGWGIFCDPRMALALSPQISGPLPWSRTGEEVLRSLRDPVRIWKGVLTTLGSAGDRVLVHDRLTSSGSENTVPECPVPREGRRLTPETVRFEPARISVLGGCSTSI